LYTSGGRSRFLYTRSATASSAYPCAEHSARSGTTGERVEIVRESLVTGERQPSGGAFDHGLAGLLPSFEYHAERNTFRGTLQETLRSTSPGGFQIARSGEKRDEIQ
jgi:hypothetical protein